MALKAIPDYSGLAVALKAPGVSAVFIDAPTEAEYPIIAKQLVEACGKDLDPARIHFISANPLNDVDYIIRSDLFSNYIQRSACDPQEAGEVYGRLMRASRAAAHATVDASSASHRLLGDGATIEMLKPDLSTEKQTAIERVSDFLAGHGFPTRIANRIATATDELLMNAIFDAPVDETGQVIYKHTSRAAEIKLEGRHAVQLLMGFDGKFAAVSVIDRFGSLQKHLLTDKISRTYKDNAYQISNSSAGAGLGVFTVFHSGVSLTYFTQPDVRTESIIFFKKTDSVREFKEQFHFLSLILRQDRKKG